MKKICILMAFAFSAASFAEFKLDPIGEEVILPSEYPKVSFVGKFNTGRSGSIKGKDFKIPLGSSFGGGMLIDVGLYQYFSAGVMLSMDYATHATHGFESFTPSLDFFARPKISFFDCLTFYSRLSAGASVLFGMPNIFLKRYGSEDVKSMMNAEYTSFHYALVHPGMNASATIGVEYFPTSRIGLSLEAGLSSSYYYVTKSEMMEKIYDAQAGMYIEQQTNPFWLNTFEIPVMLNINVIL